MHDARTNGRWSGLAALTALAAALALSGCGAHNTPIDVPKVGERDLPLPPPVTSYRLVPQDNLSIRYYGNEELDGSQPIRPDGKISLAYVGQVQAAGLTPEELETKLVELYTGELASPRINVIVTSFAPQRFYIGGAVNGNGTQDIHGEINLLQAIQMAGGLSNEARAGQVIVIRADENGYPVGARFDLKRLQAGNTEFANPRIYPNDVIFVPRAKVVNMATWVDNYIGGLIPNLPGFGFVIRDISNNNNSSNTTTTTTAPP